MGTSAAAAVGASVMGTASAQEDDDTEGAPSVKGELKRFASTALGAEVTGPFVTEDGTLIMSCQHPARRNPEPFNRGSVGYFKGFTFDLSGNGDDFDELSIPEIEEERSRVRASGGEYTVLAAEGDNIANNEDWGIPVTPDGIPIEEFSGSRYSNFGYDPDMNQFVATNGSGTKGYLFTNIEQSPGNVTRTPIRKRGDEWEADLENAVNLANTDALRELGGTRINCYGDKTPWNTPVSAEEEYAHPRLSLTATTSGILEEGSGVGYRGACQFWNRPDPAEVGSSEWYDEYNGGMYPQGAFALGGVELTAYYLGAEPVDQNSDYTENDKTPIGEGYPNPYRTGYVVDFREPDADEPSPVKYYVMGRAAWEAPAFMYDNRTVYLNSDGNNKGIYKFVADEPIPSYDDPMDVAGTLYAPKVTNVEEAASGASPAEVNLQLEWMAMAHATNREVHEWIAEYDDVSQVDYLESHAETDWEKDLERALHEADREVAENGNRDYISDEDIKKWGELWSPDPESDVTDRGDYEHLRKVPFLETRAAAKEIGATIEFRKAEGVDCFDGAGPGDYVYYGISEVNDGMTDDEGDVRMDRVDGGLVYRGQLEEDYDISELEPVIVGPDASDPASVANDALINVDNVYVMNDGRVLCCEDADQFGRSYPNDCLYVFTPEEMLNGDEEGEEGNGESENGNDDSEEDE
jgi:secreted PhoX family phosphatase